MFTRKPLRFGSNDVITQDKGTNVEFFPDVLKEFTKLHPCRKFHTGMSIYSRETADGTCILYVFCTMPFWTAHSPQNDDVINVCCQSKL